MFKRTILPKIWKNIDSDKILLLNGARQVGKTTLIKMIQEKLVNERNVPLSNIYWFDLEKIDDLDIWSNQNSALAVLPIKSKEKQYVFIDEFQKSKSIGSILKVLHDHYPQFKIIITGSASWYLSMKESLAGRKTVYPIWPLSFEEFVEWKQDKNLKKYYEISKQDINNTNSSMIEIINNAWLEFVAYGGYPEVVKTSDSQKKISILSELIDAYLMRDVKIWNYGANTLQIKKLLTLIAARISSLMNINELCLNSELGRTKLENRIEFLQNTFILHLNRPYFTNKTKELVKNPKAYLVDTGLRNSLMGNFSIKPQTSDFGFLAENTVVTNLQKTSDELDKIYFWRTKTGKEVDIIKGRGKELVPIGIKSGNENYTPSSLKLFIDQYNPKQAYVLNWSIIKDVQYKGTAVKFRPLWFLT